MRSICKKKRRLTPAVVPGLGAQRASLCHQEYLPANIRRQGKKKKPTSHPDAASVLFIRSAFLTARCGSSCHQRRSDRPHLRAYRDSSCHIPPFLFGCVYCSTFLTALQALFWLYYINLLLTFCIICASPFDSPVLTVMRECCRNYGNPWNFQLFFQPLCLFFPSHCSGLLWYNEDSSVGDFVFPAEPLEPREYF